MELTNEDIKILQSILKHVIKHKRLFVQMHPTPVDELDVKIDKINHIHIFDFIEQSGYLTIERTKDQIIVISNGIYSERFLEKGGFEKYYIDFVSANEEENHKKIEEKEIRILTIKELKGNIFQLKYWWVILLINIAVSVIFTLLTIIYSKN